MQHMVDMCRVKATNADLLACSCDRQMTNQDVSGTIEVPVTAKTTIVALTGKCFLSTKLVVDRTTHSTSLARKLLRSLNHLARKRLGLQREVGTKPKVTPRAHHLGSLGVEPTVSSPNHLLRFERWD